MKVCLCLYIVDTNKKKTLSVHLLLSCCCFFEMFLKLILFLEDENVRAKLINDAFCYQSLLPESHVFPKDTATKYQGPVIAKSCKEGFSRESLKANFDQVYHSNIDIFFECGRMGAGRFKVVPENFAKFTEKHLRRNLFLTKLLACSLHASY